MTPVAREKCVSIGVAAKCCVAPSARVFAWSANGDLCSTLKRPRQRCGFIGLFDSLDLIERNIREYR
jgi:hypothetical protein